MGQLVQYKKINFARIFSLKIPSLFFSQVDLIAVMHLCDYRQLLKLNLSGSLAAELGRLSHMQIM